MARFAQSSLACALAVVVLRRDACAFRTKTHKKKASRAGARTVAGVPLYEAPDTLAHVDESMVAFGPEVPSVADELPPFFGIGGDDTMFCSGGRNRSVCPRRGDNYLATGGNGVGTGGGGMCKFRYTWHDGPGENTGSPVVTSGACNITIADLGKGTHTNTRVRAWIRSLAAQDSCEMDDAGHILANQLGGCGSCPVNLFPQNLRINRGAYRMMELAIYNCVALGNVTARLSWKFLYQAPALKHLRPASYNYTAAFEGGACGGMALTSLFQNEPWSPLEQASDDSELRRQVEELAALVKGGPH